MFNQSNVSIHLLITGIIIRQLNQGHLLFANLEFMYAIWYRC